MAKLYKLVVTGTFNAGKTTFINTLSDIHAVDTDKVTRRGAEAKIKSATTVALDYGRVKLANHVNLHLYGTPGQKRFDFMRDLLTVGMHGFIFLVDSTDPRALKPATELLTSLSQRSDVPYLLVANKTDQNGMNCTEIRKQLRLSKQEPIVSCVATDKNSVRAVVECLVAMIEASP